MIKDRRDNSLTRGSIKNVTFKILSEFIAKPIVLIYTILLTRLLTPYQYGTFTVAITFAIFAGVISDFGLSTIALRESSIYKEAKLRQFISTLFSFKVLVIIVIAIISILFITYGPIEFTSNTTTILLTLSLCFYWFIEVLLSILRSKFLPEKETLLFVLWRVVLLITTAILVYIQRTTVSAAVSHLITSVSVFILGIFLVKRFISDIDVNISSDMLKGMFKSTIFVFFSSLFIIAYFRIDIIIMSLVGILPDEIGRYGAVYKIIDAIMVFPSAISAGIFPALSRVTKGEQHDIHKTGEILRPMLFFGLLCLIIITPISKPIITLIYGSPFAQAYNILNILIWALPFIFVNFILYSILICLGLERYNMITTMICLLFNVILNMFLIPRFGALGAALTTVLTEIILTLLCAIILHNKIKFHLLLLFTGFSISTFIIFCEYYINQWWSLLPAFTLFTVLSFYIGLIRRTDISIILENIRRR
ncbi:MAG: flippase [bacterium]